MIAVIGQSGPCSTVMVCKVMAGGSIKSVEYCIDNFCSGDSDSTVPVSIVSLIFLPLRLV